MSPRSSAGRQVNSGAVGFCDLQHQHFVLRFTKKSLYYVSQNCLLLIGIPWLALMT